MKNSVEPDQAGSVPGSPAVCAQIADVLAAMRYGSVEITVHDGRIVQIEKRERVRLGPVDSRQTRSTA